MGKVDAGTKRKWEEQLDYTSHTLWSECESALNKRYHQMVAEEACKPKIVQQSRVYPKRNGSRSFLFVAAMDDPEVCVFCNIK